MIKLFGKRAKDEPLQAKGESVEWYDFADANWAANAHKFEEAVLLLDRALELEPGESWILAMKATFLRELGKFEDA